MNRDNIKIIRSAKRKKTIQAKMVDSKLWIYLPSGLTKAEEQKWITTMIEKSENQKRRQKLNSDGLLQKRAKELNKEYFNGVLDFDIKYVTNQISKFGSCTPKTNMIRISDRIAKMPKWVRDYVIIHELAHLDNPNHSRKFWKKVNQYKYAERAKGYLIAVGMIDE
ncbi:MAG: M48 family metallopeptidase [Thermoplasmatales archaeon]|nr:MAG: M48 family metallopeptidase [Thermoplasmatales archaeon]